VPCVTSAATSVVSSVVTSIDRFFQFSLLGLVASGFFALAGSHYLDPPTLWLTFAALVVRALTIPGILRLEISPRVVSYAAIGYIVFYPFDFYLLSRDFFTATVHGVCFLAAVKILTARTNRDYLYTGAVAFIELIGAAVLSFQASFFGWLALYILFAMAAFTSAEIRRGLERKGACGVAFGVSGLQRNVRNSDHHRRPVFDCAAHCARRRDVVSQCAAPDGLLERGRPWGFWGDQ
jgi:hypothetical protein